MSVLRASVPLPHMPGHWIRLALTECMRAQVAAACAREAAAVAAAHAEGQEARELLVEKEATLQVCAKQSPALSHSLCSYVCVCCEGSGRGVSAAGNHPSRPILA